MSFQVFQLQFCVPGYGCAFYMSKALKLLVLFKIEESQRTQLFEREGEG
jgi:hypothetical protein